MTSAPSGKTIVLVTRARKISSVAVMPSVRLVDTVLACGVRTCNSCICAWRAPNTVWCSFTNYWRASMVMSLTVSPMSCRSPSVRVVGLKEVLEAFDFFYVPTCTLGRCRFNCVDVVCGSTPPSSGSISCSGEGDFWPQCSFSAALLLPSQRRAPPTPWLLLLHSFTFLPTAPYEVLPCPFSSARRTYFLPPWSWLERTTPATTTQAW